MKNNLDLPGFQAFLENSGSIPPQHVRYYLRWVEQLLSRHNFSLINITKGDIQNFLNSLTAKKAPEWQVKQASHAIDLYLTRFLKLELPDKALSWDDVLSDCQEIFEKKSYSANTVKSYTKWCRKFAEYIHPVPPHQLDDSSFVVLSI